MVTVTKDTITVHRLVQAVVREGLDQPTRQRWALTRAGRFLQARDNVRRRLARSNRLTGKAELLGGDRLRATPRPELLPP